MTLRIGRVHAMVRADIVSCTVAIGDGLRFGRSTNDIPSSMSDLQLSVLKALDVGISLISEPEHVSAMEGTVQLAIGVRLLPSTRQMSIALDISHPHAR